MLQLPNGPDDGGLAVMNRTAPLFEQYFKENEAVSQGVQNKNDLMC